MNRILVVGEDSLCCALGERLVAVCLPRWRLARESIDTGGRTKLLPELPRYGQQAAHVQPVLCIADTDGDCAVELRQVAIRQPDSANFLFRLAVSEAESWLIADCDGAAEALGIPQSKLPLRPDDEPDPKRLILTLAARSKLRHIRDEVVSNHDRNKPGSGYNLHLSAFVRSHWDAHRAAQVSPSLARAVRRIDELKAMVAG
jgi:hypothetical protein